ncbi:MAG TPA: hypothetical protein VMT53_18660 [Terriglobales bacterium]|nr:hypothetical protein [Terriglobales bacterium]
MGTQTLSIQKPEELGLQAEDLEAEDVEEPELELVRVGAPVSSRVPPDSSIYTQTHSTSTYVIDALGRDS